MTIAIDSSTPAFVTGTSNPVTTSAFSPPANSMLVAFCGADESNTFVVANASGTALTWTQVDSIGLAGFNSGAIWVAFTGGSAPGSVTIKSTKTGSFTANSLKVIVLTGTEQAFTGAHTNATNAATVSPVATVTGSWAFDAFGNSGGGTTDTAATACVYEAAETAFGGVAAGVIRRTTADGVSGTGSAVGIATHQFSETHVAIEIKPGSVAVNVGAQSTARHPGKSPGYGGARFWQSPRATDTALASSTLADTAQGTVLGSTSDTIAVGVALADTAAGIRSGSTTDTVAVGVTLADPSVGGIRSGNNAGESAVNSVALADPGVGGARFGGNADAIAIGAVSADLSAGGLRFGGTTGTSATGIVLTDSSAASRLGSSVDTLATGVVVADSGAGGSRAGDTLGETATVALSITDPSVGGVRAGSATGATAFGVVLADTPGAVTSGGGRETVAAGIVLLDVITASRSGSAADTLAVGTALADASAGGARAGNVQGETVASALPLADPTVGGIRFGGTAGSVTSSLAIADTVGGIRFGGTVDTIRAALVLTDVAGSIRFGSAADSLSLILPAARGEMTAVDRAANTMRPAGRPTARMEPAVRTGPTMKGG